MGKSKLKKSRSAVTPTSFTPVPPRAPTPPPTLTALRSTASTAEQSTVSADGVLVAETTSLPTNGKDKESEVMEISPIQFGNVENGRSNKAPSIRSVSSTHNASSPSSNPPSPSSSSSALSLLRNRLTNDEATRLRMAALATEETEKENKGTGKLRKKRPVQFKTGSEEESAKGGRERGDSQSTFAESLSTTTSGEAEEEVGGENGEGKEEVLSEAVVVSPEVEDGKDEDSKSAATSTEVALSRSAQPVVKPTFGILSIPASLLTIFYPSSLLSILPTLPSLPSFVPTSTSTTTSSPSTSTDADETEIDSPPPTHNTPTPTEDENENKEETQLVLYYKDESIVWDLVQLGAAVGWAGVLMASVAGDRVWEKLVGGGGVGEEKRIERKVVD